MINIWLFVLISIMNKLGENKNKKYSFFEIYIDLNNNDVTMIHF